MNNIEIKEQIIQEILQIPIGEQFCFEQILEKYSNLSDRERREICYSVCFWLETQNFIELEFSMNSFSPYDKQMSTLLSQNLFLKQEKENYVKFNNFNYDYKCIVGLAYNLYQFKISKQRIAFLTGKNKNLFVIDDVSKMTKIWNDFNLFVKKAHRQFKNRGVTGTLKESIWLKPSIFKKIPDAEEAKDFFLEIFKENGFTI